LLGVEERAGMAGWWSRAASARWFFTWERGALDLWESYGIVDTYYLVFNHL